MSQNHTGVGPNDPSDRRGSSGRNGIGADGGGQRDPGSSDRNRTDLVSILGIVTICFGGIKLLCGGGLLVGLGYFYDDLVGLLSVPNQPSPEQLSSMVYMVLVVVLVVFLLIPGLLQVIAGTGVLKRAKWGRILTIILGGLDAVLSLPNLMSGNVVMFILSGGWGVFALYVLLSDPYQNEFYDR